MFLRKILCNITQTPFSSPKFCHFMTNQQSAPIFDIPSLEEVENEPVPVPTVPSPAITTTTTPITPSAPSHFIPGVTTNNPPISSPPIIRKPVTPQYPNKSTIKYNKGAPVTPNKVSLTQIKTAGTPTSHKGILVSKRQEKNPVLKYIENCYYSFSDAIVPDFVFSPTRCALFLSLKYHSEHPGYLEARLKEIPYCFELKILLCLVDVPESTTPLKHVTKLGILHNLTLICVWSNLEAGRYLETLKIYESKPADSIMGKVEEDFESRFIDCLTSVKTVNKRDVTNLGSNFGTLKRIIEADMEELAVTPGLGAKKVKDIFYTFRQPFKTKPSPPTSQESESTSISSQPSTNEQNKESENDV